MPVFQPSFIVDTGGKSLHFYWRLARMITPEKFEEMQKRLVKLIEKVNPNFGVDESLCKSNQILRIPGGLHGKTGKRCKLYRIGGWLHRRVLCDGKQQPYWEWSLVYGVEFFEQGLSIAEYVWEVDTTPEQKTINEEESSFISKIAREDLSQDGQWFSRLDKEVQQPLALRCSSLYQRERKLEKEMEVCISILYGLKRHFGEAEAAIFASKLIGGVLIGIQLRSSFPTESN